jgi:hypothetical protein
MIMADDRVVKSALAADELIQELRRFGAKHR